LGARWVILGKFKVKTRFCLGVEYGENNLIFYRHLSWPFADGALYPFLSSSRAEPVNK
jgi:hypothetical protein